MERAVKFFIALFFAALLGGCSSQRSSESGSFYHRKEAENVYVIGFSGNGSRNSQRAQDFTLLLAAQIGQKLGYAYFVVLGRQDTSKVRIAEKGAPASMPGRVKGPGNAASSRTTPATMRGVEIRVLYTNRAPKGRPGEVYTINDVIRFIKSKYNITT